MLFLICSLWACGPKKDETKNPIETTTKTTTKTKTSDTILEENPVPSESHSTHEESNHSTSNKTLSTSEELAWYEDPEEEAVIVDPKTLWPHKIVLDSQNQKLLMVWFDDDPPKSLSINFSGVQNLHSIPSDQGMGAELQLETTDGAYYLAAYSFAGTQQQSLLLSAVLGSNVQNNAPNDMRIVTKELNTRPQPKLVVGSADDPAVFEPIGDVVEDTLLHKSAVGEEIGEEVPDKSSGKLSRASVELEIKRNMSRFRSCYQKALAQVPDLQGTVQIQFSVGSGGSVLGARVQSSSLKNATAERCILRNIYGIRFDSPAGGTAIFTYPFSFTRL